jgi:hypothetical protein
VNELEWLIANAAGKGAQEETNWFYDNEKTIISQADEIISNPSNVYNFTMKDYHELLSAAINIIPDSGEDEVCNIIKLVCIVKFGASKTVVIKEKEKIIEAFKSQQSMRMETALQSSKLLKDILQNTWSNTAYPTIRQLLEAAFHEKVEAKIIKGACKAIRDYENSILLCTSDIMH